MKNLLNLGNHREKYELALEELNCRVTCSDCFWFKDEYCSLLRKVRFGIDLPCQEFIEDD